jgi:hypothetical protein
MTQDVGVSASASRTRAVALVLVVVEDDEVRSLFETGAQGWEEGVALARRAEAQREHLAQGARVPGADAKPVDAAREAARQDVSQRRGEDGLAAAAGADERDARRSDGDDGANERRELARAAAEPGTRRKVRRRRQPTAHTTGKCRVRDA